MPVEELSQHLEDSREIQIHTSYALMFDDNYVEILLLAKRVLEGREGRAELEPDDLANKAAILILEVKDHRIGLFSLTNSGR